MLRILPAESAGHIASARALFEEYAAAMGVNFCFQNFAEELAGLPGRYAPPEGRLLLAWQDKRLAGCVALREFSPGICEMKRLFVRPAFRKQGVGRRLAVSVIAEARAIGHTHMRLDTLAVMREAIALYESLGFRRIDPYCFNPLPGVVYMELGLGNALE